MAIGDAQLFPGFLTPALTQLSCPKLQTTFLTCFCRGERRKYAGKKVPLNCGSNSQPPGHESDTFTSEPPGRCDSFELCINPFPNDKFLTRPNSKSLKMTISNWMKMAESYGNRYKTLGEKEQLLVTSNFSFSHSIFKRLVLQTRKNQGLFGKGLSVKNFQY